MAQFLSPEGRVRIRGRCHAGGPEVHRERDEARAHGAAGRVWLDEVQREDRRAASNSIGTSVVLVDPFGSSLLAQFDQFYANSMPRVIELGGFWLNSMTRGIELA